MFIQTQLKAVSNTALFCAGLLTAYSLLLAAFPKRKVWSEEVCYHIFFQTFDWQISQLYL